jgi:hypothetical protein
LVLIKYAHDIDDLGRIQRVDGDLSHSVTSSFVRSMFYGVMISAKFLITVVREFKRDF